MTVPDLKLVEVCDPPMIGNRLYVEESLAGDKTVFLIICGGDEDPSTKGIMMELKRDAAAQLRDWLNAVLAASNQIMTSRTTLRQPPDIHEIRSRYTSPDNACKPAQISKLAPIAIAYDIAVLVSEIEDLRNEVSRLKAELHAVQLTGER